MWHQMLYDVTYLHCRKKIGSDGLLCLQALAELLTTNKLSELACLTLYLMYEKKNGKQSVWYEFIKVSAPDTRLPSLRVAE